MPKCSSATTFSNTWPTTGRPYANCIASCGRGGGWGVVLSPVDPDRAETFEDDSITDPAERTRIFGQYDHRRIYGRDYAARLAEAGFRVEEIDYASRFTAEERRRYALPADRLYIVRK